MSNYKVVVATGKHPGGRVLANPLVLRGRFVSDADSIPEREGERAFMFKDINWNKNWQSINTFDCVSSYCHSLSLSDPFERLNCGWFPLTMKGNRSTSLICCYCNYVGFHGAAKADNQKIIQSSLTFHIPAIRMHFPIFRSLLTNL